MNALHLDLLFLEAFNLPLSSIWGLDEVHQLPPKKKIDTWISGKLKIVGQGTSTKQQNKNDT